ncbi:hypothetical protein Y032_0565g10 [Ancylostoma ceylanicum]|uniref:Uncharacterized protein n=1 Tax=Ancylostoma ceylanicum TaxID=53326 RepID=A0A016WPI5_9BILA|nr:hypothetical protein Y032_0565g10 [Ancylostoma ceylanicum]
MIEVAIYRAHSRHANSSNVHQQAQKRQKPAPEGIEMAETWSREADRSKLSWPATAAALANESWCVHSTRSTASHVTSSPGTVTDPVLEHGLKDRFETIHVYR